MIITHLKKTQAEVPIEHIQTEPSRDWRYERGDGKTVKWEKDSDYWHIPHLVKMSRLAEPQYADGEQYNEGEIEEYYIDPTTGDEVKPGYKIRDIIQRIAGPITIECMALLTKDEVAWLRPDLKKKPNEYKQRIVVDWGGIRLLLTGVWLSRNSDPVDDLYECELSVDNVEAADPNLRLTEIGSVKP